MTRRSVSTRIPSKAGPSRVSSMIVHDIDEEDNEENNNAEVEASAPPTPQPSLIPPPRTRKAKEMQVRLGVGKPIAAGGTGPRAITRSSESSRNRRLKSSRSIIKPMEATIEEGWRHSLLFMCRKRCLILHIQNRKSQAYRHRVCLPEIV